MQPHFTFKNQMGKPIATLSSKGQITVPVAVRHRLGLKAGDRILMEVAGDQITLSPSTSRLAAGYRSIPALAEPKTWGEIEEIVAEERAEAYAEKWGEGQP